MLPAYQKYLDLAKKKSAENKKFLERLKKQKVAQLDEIVQELNDIAFEEIDWLAKELKMRPANFTEQYLKVDEDRDYIFQQLPCPFLGSDHYCQVYNARPNACREYPHTHQRDQLQKLKITYANSLICPAVAKIVEEMKAEIKS
jgi:Fe-S-cluster containining protein